MVHAQGGEVVKSITVHNLGDPLDRAIRQRAKRQGTSLNRTIKLLLEEALGLVRKPEDQQQNDFADLCGIWSAGEEQELMNAVSDLEHVDHGDWR